MVVGAGLGLVTVALFAVPAFYSAKPPGPDRANLQMSEYLRRCAGVTSGRDLQVAAVDYRDSVSLKVGKPVRYSMRLVPPPDAGPSAGPRVRVACSVSARLVLPDGVDVNPTDWVERKHLPGDPAQWTWTMEGQRAGTFPGSLELRPAVRWKGSDGSMQEGDLGTEEFPVDVETTETLGQKVRGAWKELVGAATGVTAIAAALGLLWRRKRNQGKSTPAADREGQSSSPGNS